MAIYKLVLVLDQQPEGGYTVTSPALPELVTEGGSVEEALANARDALAVLIEAAQELDRPLSAALVPVDDSAPLTIEAALTVP